MKTNLNNMNEKMEKSIASYANEITKLTQVPLKNGFTFDYYYDSSTNIQFIDKDGKKHII